MTRSVSIVDDDRRDRSAAGHRAGSPPVRRDTVATGRRRHIRVAAGSAAARWSVPGGASAAATGHAAHR